MVKLVHDLVDMKRNSPSRERKECTMIELNRKRRRMGRQEDIIRSR